MDIGSPWCPQCITREEAWGVIHPKLIAFETMTWDEIRRGTGSHNVRIEKLIPEAKKRLEDYSLEDAETLFSLRLMGRPRLWGLLINGVFNVLWWDPNHQVCPSLKE